MKYNNYTAFFFTLLINLFFFNSTFAQSIDDLYWEYVNQPDSTGVTHIQFDKNNVLYTSTLGKNFYKSNDLGNTWQQVNDEPILKDVEIFAIKDSLVVGGRFIKILISRDQGKTWAEAYFDEYLHVMDIIIPTDSIIFVATYNKGIIASYDSGETWHELDNKGIEKNEYVHALHHYKDQTIYLGRYDIENNLYYSNNWGKSWQLINKKNNYYWHPSVTDIESDSFGTIWITNAHGSYEGIYNSVDCGKTWNEVKKMDVQGHFTINTQNCIFIATSEGISFPINNLNNWQTIKTGLNDYRILYLRSSLDDYIFGVVTDGYGFSKGKIFRSSIPTTFLKLDKDALGYNENNLDHETEIPNSLTLYDNYPNPFNAGTTFKFYLPNPYKLNLTIYDRLGRQVANPVSKKYSKGLHVINWDPGALPSGIYFYKITAGSFTKTGKMALVK